MKKAIGLVLVVCCVSTLVMAETSGDKEADGKGADPAVSRQRPEGAPRVSPGRRGDPRSRQQAY
ncbi:MAG: hypothetical protein ACYSOL_06795, partial [Planctomycetota bacterium]